ncbi:glutathione S-transferase C-terminal domain-containing protein homolog [Bacillus rossius redtenbacheri]|uniref:glutathione S-transferase C-terminal domain-containing protein homolog n=1 Tax=Bacillus rossius redtenbacheri TaxID=93214 RepID=UPI002FDC98F7
MDVLYVDVFSRPENDCVQAPLETLISLCTLKFLQDSPVNLVFVLKPAINPVFTVRVSCFEYDLIEVPDLPHLATICQLPVVVLTNSSSVVAGLCAVLRQVVKCTVALFPGHHCGNLLGFRQGCLIACAESSLWTRFCEVDVISSVKSVIAGQQEQSDVVVLPEDLVRFEIHMAQPLRIHNIQKVYQDHVKSAGRLSVELEHSFAEGPAMTLADIILLPCFHILLEAVKSVYLPQHLPLTMKWFGLVRSRQGAEEALGLIRGLGGGLAGRLYVDYVVPDLPKQSLYKSDPKRYKPRRRIFTRQEDVEVSVKLALDLGVVPDWQDVPFGWEQEFDWSSLPPEAHPKGGHLPVQRQERKAQQLENLAKAVLKIAQPGHIIVDFCSGSGHLGIVLAHLLPRCQVVLLENKEESLGRARERVARLGLPNVTFCQCNLDYFCADFDVGASLHACGVATDLVIRRCVRHGAAFVSCPCCYGSVQDNHVLSYPRSRALRDAGMTPREYLVLGHSADQTHGDADAKTGQGRLCMGLIDADRCLQAREHGYTVSLAKLVPPSCTPKNNLLVGVPRHWRVAR